MKRASWNSPRMASIASTPLISGICKSISVTSGRHSRNFAMPSRPLEASPTSFISDSGATSVAIPTRIKGWSSTARMRIGARSLLTRSMLMSLSHFLTKQPETSASMRLVSDGGGDAQLHPRPAPQFAPETHVPADAFGALAHPRQAPVSGEPFVAKHARVNAASIIPDPYPKLPLVIADIHFDPARPCVAKCIAQRLPCNPVDFVPEDRLQLLRRTFHLHQESR